MKKWVIIALLVGVNSVLGASDRNTTKDQVSLCKLFQEKAIKYKKTMRNDDYARATLASYKKRAALYCAEGR